MNRSCDGCCRFRGVRWVGETAYAECALHNVSIIPDHGCGWWAPKDDGQRSMFGGVE